MKDAKRDEADRLIEQFLEERVQPTKQEWKALVDRHPEHASAFIAAALARESGDVREAESAYELDQGLADTTVSMVLNLVSQAPSRTLQATQQLVEEFKGKRAGELAEQVGIGRSYASLMSGVLAGRTEAPARVVSALQGLWSVHSAALLESFRRSFEGRHVPAFKSQQKPDLAPQPESWEAAVRSLKVSPAETGRLLKLAEADRDEPVRASSK